MGPQLSSTATGRSSGAVVVAIHDVAPCTLAACRALAARLDATGVAPLALLVVPAFHGDPPFGRDSQTADWLATRLARGDEILLHGYRHLADRPPRTRGARLRAALLTAGEGEFLALTESEAAGRLAAGLEALAAAGLPRPQGFVAPAWLLGEEARGAAARLGFRYTTTRRRLVDLEHGREYPAPALSLSCRTPARTLASRVALPWLWRAFRGASLVRFALHPADAGAPAALAAALRLVDEARRGRAVVTYAEALERARAGGATDGVASQRRPLPGSSGSPRPLGRSSSGTCGPGTA